MELIKKYYKHLFIVPAATLLLTACATAPIETSTSTEDVPIKTEVSTETEDVSTETDASTEIEEAAIEEATPESTVEDGVYVGGETIEMLAINVPDRVFFAYDSYSLTDAAQSTLSKQAQWLKENPSVTISIQGHADERGTREYNLALGDRRANSAKDFLMSQGISSNRVTTISFGKERPVKSGSNDMAWAQNRRSVTIRTN